VLNAIEREVIAQAGAETEVARIIEAIN